MKSRFDGLGDVQLPIGPREPVREPLAIQEPSGAYAAVPLPEASAARPARRRKPAR